MKFVFEYSKNNQYSKDVVNAIFNFFITNKFKIQKILSTSDNNEINYFYKKTIYKFLNSIFINNENKNYLKNIKLILEKK